VCEAWWRGGGFAVECSAPLTSGERGFAAISAEWAPNAANRPSAASKSSAQGVSSQGESMLSNGVGSPVVWWTGFSKDAASKCGSPHCAQCNSCDCSPPATPGTSCLQRLHHIVSANCLAAVCAACLPGAATHNPTNVFRGASSQTSALAALNCSDYKENPGGRSRFFPTSALTARYILAEPPL